MPDETEETRRRVTDFYVRYGAGDVDAVAGALSEDVDWAICVPTYLFEFAGPRRGPAAVRQALAAIWAEYEMLSHEPRMIVVDGGHACAYSEIAVRQRESGHEATIEVCDVLRLADGRIVWFREFFDAATAALALFGGRPRTE